MRRLSAILERLGLWATGTRPEDDANYQCEEWPGITMSGQPVSLDIALRNATFWACVRVISETVASLPLILYRRRAGGGKDRAADHPLYALLHDAPNERDTSFTFRETLMGWGLTHGNQYARIERDVSGRITALWPLESDKVTPELLPSGRMRFRVRERNGQEKVLLQHEVFRVPGLCFRNIEGLSPVAYHRETLGISSAQIAYLARFYRNDSRPSGILKADPTFKFANADAKEKFRESFQSYLTGPNRFKVAILEGGMAFQELGMKHTDQQFLEVMKYTRADICRIFRVPPHKVGDLDKATFANIEHQSLEFVTDCIRPWLVRWEQAIARDLIAESDLFAEFLVDGLLRGDSDARQKFYHGAVGDGWMTRNEVREKENLNPLPGLDDPLVPLNMAPAKAVQQVGDRAATIVRAAARSAVRMEKARVLESVKRAGSDPAAFAAQLARAYADISTYIAGKLALPEQTVLAWCDANRYAVLKGGAAVAEAWGDEQEERLARLAMEVNS